MNITHLLFVLVVMAAITDAPRDRLGGDPDTVIRELYSHYAAWQRLLFSWQGGGASRPFAGAGPGECCRGILASRRGGTRGWELWRQAARRAPRPRASPARAGRTAAVASGGAMPGRQDRPFPATYRWQRPLLTLVSVGHLDGPPSAVACCDRPRGPDAATAQRRCCHQLLTRIGDEGCSGRDEPGKGP